MFGIDGWNLEIRDEGEEEISRNFSRRRRVFDFGWSICDFTLSAFYVIINPSTCLHVESWIRV